MHSPSQPALPRVSVITVNYNSGDLLGRTLDSFRSQQYKDMEVIVVDGGSTDGATDVIREHQDIVTRWVSEPDRGIYDAMNKGAGMATGEWIVFINAGDQLLGGALTNVFSHDTSQADIVYGDIRKDGAVRVAPDTYRLYHRMLFCHQSVFCRRSLLQDLPFDISHRYSADHKFFVQQWQRGARFMHVPVAVAVFDTTGVSNSQRSRALRDNMRVMRETLGPLRSLPHTLRLLVPYVACRLRGR